MFKQLGQIVSILFISVFILGASRCETDSTKVSVTDEMLNGFSQTCQMGPWTKAALSKSNQLTNIYQSLLDKATCKDNPGLQTALNSTYAIQSELRAIQEDELRMKERAFDELNYDLLLALNDPNMSPDTKLYLSSSYSTARYELSMVRSELNYGLSNHSRKVFGLYNINRQINNLLNANSTIAQCLKDNPSAAMQIGAGLLEVAGAFASPIIGLGAVAISGLYKLGVETTRSLPISDAIYESRKTRFPMAITCGLESFSRDICKAQDASLLVNLPRKNETQEALPFFKGIELQDKYLPILYEWLDKVIGGAGVIKDEEQAQKINKQFEIVQVAKSSFNRFNGIFNESFTKIGKATSEESKKDIISGTIISLVEIYYPCNRGFGDPDPCNHSLFSTRNAVSFVEMILEGIVYQRPDGVNSYRDLINAARKAFNGDSLGIIKENINRAYTVRYSEVIREFNEKVNIDLPSLVREGTRKNRDGISPLVSLRRTIHFLDQYAFEDNSSADMDRIIISQIREKLITLYTEIMKPESVIDECEGGGKKETCSTLTPAGRFIALVKELFKLDNNNVYLPSVMQGIIRTDLNTRFHRGEVPTDIQEIYKVASADLNLLLERYRLTPHLINEDLFNAQQISYSNLKQIREFFAPILKEVLKDLTKQANENREPVAGNLNSPIRNVISRICIMTLITGNSWPFEVDLKLCKGAKIISEEAGLELSFDELFKSQSSQSLSSRVCTYEKFLRADRIANVREYMLKVKSNQDIY